MHALTTAELFRVVWPRHTAKHAAQAADGPVATAKAWVQARFTPSADTLLRMARENAELRAELVRRLGEWDADRMESGSRPLATEADGGTGAAGGLDRPAALTPAAEGRRDRTADGARGAAVGGETRDGGR